MLENGYEKIENELKTGLKDVANRAKNAQEYNKQKQNLKNSMDKREDEPVENSTQTERDILKERFEKL